MVNKTKSPCLGCTDRKLACHDSCDKYKAFKEENQKIKDKIYKDKEVNDALRGYNKAKGKGIDQSKYRKR